jgi:hypothetical protein
MNDKGFIDLGKKYGGKNDTMISDSPKEHVDYPTLFIRHDIGDKSGLDEIPDGEFEFTAKGRLVRYTEDLKNGTCSCEIEVLSIKPSSRKVKKAKSSEDSLDEALTEVARKKAK